MKDLEMFHRLMQDEQSRISRRDLLKLGASGLGLTGLYLLTGCRPAATPTPSPAEVTPSPTKPKVVKPKYGGTLRVGQWDEPRTMNVMVEQSDVPFINVGGNVYNSVIRWDYDKKQVVPELATEWYQEDPTTWVFKLREGVRFHKGYGEMAAEDVAFSANYIIENQVGHQYLFQFVKGATPIDKYTVKYELERPFAPFLVTACGYVGGCVVCKKAFEEMGKEAFDRMPVATGPFEVAEWVSGDHITLKRFEDYWEEGLPYLDEIVWKLVPDAYVREMMLRTGEVDFVDVPVFKNLEALKQDPNIVIHTTPGWNWDYLTFDCAKTPFDIKEVRQAFACAVDRQEIVDKVYYGYAERDDDMLPSGYLGGDPDIQVWPNTADVEKAKELLAKAGYPDGFKTTCITSSKDHIRRELEIVAEQLKRVGIELEIQQLDDATYTKRVRGASDFEVELEDIAIMSADPDSTFWWFYHSDTTREHHHATPEVDRMLEQGRSGDDMTLEERADLYRKLTKMLVEESFYVYFCHVNQVRLAHKDMKGFVVTPSDMDVIFKKVWLDRA